MIMNFTFYQVFTLSLFFLTMNHQSHMNNIIWHSNFKGKHIFVSTLVKNNAIQFTSFLELLDKFIDSKKKVFFIIYSKTFKTRASRLPVE